MIVREAVGSDLPAIASMWVQFMEEHDSRAILSNPSLKPYLIRRKDSLRRFSAYMRTNIRSQKAMVLVAEDKGLVGYSLSYIRKNMPIHMIDRIGYISDLFVTKAFRNRGIASLFMERSMRWFKSKGISHASIQVFSTNRLAGTIYRKWGFFDYHIEMRRKI